MWLQDINPKTGRYRSLSFPTYTASSPPSLLRKNVHAKPILKVYFSSLFCYVRSSSTIRDIAVLRREESWEKGGNAVCRGSFIDHSRYIRSHAATSSRIPHAYRGLSFRAVTWSTSHAKSRLFNHSWPFCHLVTCPHENHSPVALSYGRYNVALALGTLLEFLVSQRCVHFRKKGQRSVGKR